MPELRRDILTGDWRIVDTGSFEKLPDENPETCPLCPGNEHLTDSEIMSFRLNGLADEPGWFIRVVPSKNPILQFSQVERKGVGMYDQINNKGANEIVVVTPEHGKRMSELPPHQMADVLWAYQKRIIDLKRDSAIKEILIYHLENSSTGHSRSHIFGLPVIDPNLGKILTESRRHYASKERCLTCDIVREENKTAERIIYENENFIAFLPYAPSKNYSVIITPKKHSAFFENFISPQNASDLAGIILDILKRYEVVFNHFPWSFVLYTAPNMAGRSSEHQWLTLADDFHWFIEFLPSIDSPMSNFHRLTGICTTVETPEEQAKILREAKIY
ncbi:MAG: hypothetical protein Q8N21_03495 [bacterium]|nr:hypothetical protein [bacterium]